MAVAALQSDFSARFVGTDVPADARAAAEAELAARLAEIQMLQTQLEGRLGAQREVHRRHQAAMAAQLAEWVTNQATNMQTMHQNFQGMLNAVDVGINPIVTSEKQLLNMIGHLL